jgi:hypothetical protein
MKKTDARKPNRVTDIFHGANLMTKSGSVHGSGLVQSAFRKPGSELFGDACVLAGHMK